MLTRLNMETRREHARADQPWLELMGVAVTAARYIEHLVAIYGFEAPFEAALALTPGISGRVQLRQRARSGLIVQDLLALGLTPSRIARLPQCELDVPFRDQAEALGWMYVVERGRLMSSMLHRHLVRRLPYESAIAGTYLAGSGSLGLRWQQLAAALDEIARTPVMIAQVIDGALEAFRTMRHTAPSHTPASRAA